MTSTKNKNENPQLTRRAALTTPPGAIFRNAIACLRKAKFASPGLTMFLLVSLQFILYAWAVDAREAFEKGTDAGFTLKRMKLVEPGKGWTIVEREMGLTSRGSRELESRLYFTEDNGQKWRDITPSDNRVHFLPVVYFLDRNHGWVLGSDTELSDPPPHFYLFVTTDSGKSWRTIDFPTPLVNSSETMYPTQIFFADGRHGWMLWHWAMMHSRVSALLTTKDGGKTWKRIHEPPGPGPMQFVSASDGWLIGASEGQEGIPINENDALWVTHDGGLVWKSVPLQILKDSSEQGSYLIDLRFKSHDEGIVAGAVQRTEGGATSKFVECTYRDGGKSWQFSQFDSLSATPVPGGDILYWSVFDSDSKKVELRTVGDEIHSAIPQELSPEGRFGVFHFLDNSRGWATFNNGPSAYPTIPGRRYAEVELLSTSDGGSTWQIITPLVAAQASFPPPELFTVNGIVFRFPTPTSAYALRYRRIPPATGLRYVNRTTEGGPMEIRGRGFLKENIVWIGPQTVQAGSTDGSSLKFLVPEDLPPGYYQLSVENEHGKTEEVEIAIGSAQCLRIALVQNQNVKCGEKPVIHRGQTIHIGGSGLKLGNTVWFGKEKAVPRLVMKGAAYLEVEVPDCLLPGIYNIYVSNEMETSNVVSVEVQ